MKTDGIKPEDMFPDMYEYEIVEAKQVFGKNYTCKIKRAPHFEEFQVAIVPVKDVDGKVDDVEICLTQAPACFMQAYLRKNGKRKLRISTRSGGVSELWNELVYPVIKHITEGDLGFREEK